MVASPCPPAAAGTVEVGLEPFQACVGPSTPSANTLPETPPEVTLLVCGPQVPNGVKFVSSQYSLRDPDAGKILITLNPFEFNSASIMGTFVLP